jgi:urease accessory protein UreE
MGTNFFSKKIKTQVGSQRSKDLSVCRATKGEGEELVINLQVQGPFASGTVIVWRAQ